MKRNEGSMSPVEEPDATVLDEYNKIQESTIQDVALKKLVNKQNKQSLKSKQKRQAGRPCTQREVMATYIPLKQDL